MSKVGRTISLIEDSLHSNKIRQVRFGNPSRSTGAHKWDWRLSDSDPRFVELGRDLLVEQLPVAAIMSKHNISFSTAYRYLRRLGYRRVKTGMWDWRLEKI